MVWLMLMGELSVVTKKEKSMQRIIIFLVAAVLLVGCSNGTALLPTATFEITETQPVKISPTVTPAPTKTPVPTALKESTTTPEITKCALVGNGQYFQIPGTGKILSIYEGWTANGEYYVGGYSQEGIVFCFQEKDFVGKIEEFSRYTDQYIENAPERVLDAIGKENLFEVFPFPDKDRYLYVKGVEQPKVITEYDLGMWDDEKQEAAIILNSETDFWRACGGFIPPENLRWLDENRIYVNCETDDSTKFVIDLQKKQYTYLYDCFTFSFVGYWFSPDGNQHLSLKTSQDLKIPEFAPILIADTKDFLEFYQTCEETGNPEAGVSAFLQKAKQLPITVKKFLIESKYPRVQWSMDGQYLYFTNLEPEQDENDTYGDILKYNIKTEEIEKLVKFDRLKEYDTGAEYYDFKISPLEDYMLFIHPDRVTRYILRLDELK